MIPTKACPVLCDSTASKIMAFRHPSAGIQLVKGSIEPGEHPADAALRELREESGIANAAVCQDLGLWDAQHDGQIWSFQLCSTSQSLPESWNHRCEDDGGLDLHFFWHDLNCEPSEHWHPVFRRALEFIRSSLKRTTDSPTPTSDLSA
jgi:8-oxo-dGTP pyrophosphatase MutT (NUDIX family)